LSSNFDKAYDKAHDKAYKGVGMKLKKMTVETHQDCVAITSDKFTLAVTTKVGPRIIGGFLNGGKNLFRVMPNEPLANCKTGFKLYGGHRLWHSPEMMPRTYAPDNTPVKVQETCDGIEFNSGIEELTGIEKTLTVEALGNERFRIVHRLINRNAWKIEVAPWALSVMAQGGMAVIPMKRDRQADPFAPDRFLNLWPYTNLQDPRLYFGEKYIFLRQDPKAKSACKIGLNGETGWIGYVNQGTALFKFYEHFVEAEYPDNGCSVETYSCADFCEIETVAPLYELVPGDTAEHVELWHGMYDLPEITTEADVKKHLEPEIV